MEDNNNDIDKKNNNIPNKPKDIEIYKKIPLYNDLYSLDKENNVLDKEMLKLYKHFHKEISDQDVYDYIKFVDFTGLSYDEFDNIVEHINESNFNFFIPLFTIDNIKYNLMMRLPINIIRLYGEFIKENILLVDDYDYIKSLWCKRNIDKIQYMSEKDSIIFEKYELSKELNKTYRYFKINDKIYKFMNNMKIENYIPGSYFSDLTSHVQNIDLEIIIDLMNKCEIHERHYGFVVKYSIEYNRIDILKYLRENGYVKFNVIHLNNAVTFCNFEVFEYIENCIDSYSVNHTLCMAIKHKCYKIVEYLFNAYGEIDGNYILFECVESTPKILKLVLDKGNFEKEDIDKMYEKCYKSEDEELITILDEYCSKKFEN